MKKTLARLFLVLSACGLLFATTSCKKCKECLAYERGTTLLHYYESQCYSGSGSNDKINEWEANFRAEYAGYDIICVIKSDQ